MSARNVLRAAVVTLLGMLPCVACAPARPDELADLEPLGVHVDDARPGARTVPIPSDVAARVVVGAGELRVPSSALDGALRARLVPGAVVVGDRGAAGAAGFLRVVSGVRVEGDVLVLATTPATWADAFETVSLAVSRDVEPTAGQRTLSASLPALSVRDAEVPVGASTAHLRVRVVAGSVEVSPSFDLEAAFPPPSAPEESERYAFVGIDGRISSSLSVRVDVEGPAQWPSGTAVVDTVVVDDVVAPLAARQIRFDAGGVPMSIEPRVHVGLACEVRALADTHLEIDQRADGPFTAWAELVGDEWDAATEAEPAFQPPQVRGSGEAMVHCRTRVSVELRTWDLAGPSVVIDLGDETSASVQTARGAHRLDATLTRGADDVFGTAFAPVVLARSAWPFEVEPGVLSSAPYVAGVLRSSGELNGRWAWYGDGHDCRLGGFYAVLRDVDDPSRRARVEVDADGTVRWSAPWATGYVARATRIAPDPKTASMRVELAPGTHATSGERAVLLEGTITAGPCVP